MSEDFKIPPITPIQPQSPELPPKEGEEKDGEKKKKVPEKIKPEDTVDISPEAKRLIDEESKE